MGDVATRRRFVTENVTADLSYLWEESGVSEQLQFDMAAHYKTVRLFSAIGDDRPSVRAAMTADFGLDPTANAAARASLATVVSAWESSKDFTETENRLRAEARALGSPKVVTTGDKLAMRKAVENVFGKIPDKECPCVAYIASKMEELEEGELIASPMDEMVSREEATPTELELSSSIDTVGRLRVTKQKIKAKLPCTTEEFRTKMKIECNLWLMLAAKFRNKAVLQNLSPASFDAFAKYILGEKVLLIKVPAPSGVGTTELNPPWSVILGYELAMRKAAFKLAMDDPVNLPIGLALANVIRDSELKELYFTGAIALSGMKRAAPSTAPAPLPGGVLPPPNVSKRQKKALAKAKAAAAAALAASSLAPPTGKKGGKKGKGKKGEGKGSLAFETPDGRRICFAYNNGEDCDGTCEMVHVCRIKGCYQEHPMIKHGS